MKASRILAVSLLFNLMAFSAVAYLVKSRRAPVVPSPAPAITTEDTAPRRAARTEQAAVSATGKTAASPFHWRMVESEEYQRFIANMHAVGVPDETIKDIIIADVNKLYAPRLAALRAPPKEYKYWETRTSSWGPDPADREKQKQRSDLDKEKNNLIKELLGVDPVEEARKLSGGIDYRERQFGSVPREKWEELEKLQGKFSSLEQEVYRKSEGHIDADTQVELQKINKERRAELARLLTPQELEEFELRSSNLANQMRYDLSGFDPNEEEFRKIFRLRDGFESENGRYNSYDPEASPEERKKRAEAQKQWEDQLKAELGEPRYAEYKLNQDYSYKELTRIAKRYDLPKETSKNVYDMKKTAEQQASKVRSDRSLSAEQRTAALQAIRQETEKTVGEVLGEKGMKSYKRSGGSWINNLSPERTSSSRTIINSSGSPP